jgi:hypothetical protein
MFANKTKGSIIQIKALAISHVQALFIGENIHVQKFFAIVLFFCTLWM